MAYNAESGGLPDERLLARRPWYVIGMVLIALSLVFGQPLLIVAGLLIIALGGIPAVWYRYCLVGVTVRRTLNATRAQIGDELTLTLRVENRKLLPLPRFEIEDEVTEGLPFVGVQLAPTAKPSRALLVNTLALRALQRVTRRYHLRCVARGVYQFGPVTMRSGDPFGILTREATESATERLVVCPLIVPIERLGLPARAPFGESAAPRRLLEDPLRTVGVRDYVPGDEPRRIHWKATARTGTLQSRVYEPTTRRTLMLFLDVRTYDNPALGYDPDLLELAICSAASVLAWGIDHGYAVGLYANGVLTPGDADAGGVEEEATSARGRQPYSPDDLSIQRAILSARLNLRLPPAGVPRQIDRAQALLARLIPYYAGPITQTIAAEEPHLPFGSTVAYIGTSRALGDEGAEALRRLRRHGHAVALLLTGDDRPAENDLPATYLGNAAAWTALWTEALAERGLDPQGRALPETPAATGVERQASLLAEGRL